MHHKLILTAIAVLVFAGSFLAKGLLDEPGGGQPAEVGRCRRVVSMAPSITETLFALGLGDRVVGRTRYCKFPPEVREIPQIGGYFDPNFEAIVALQPDLIVTPAENVYAMPAFTKLKLNTLSVRQQNVDEILDSITDIGRAFGVQQKARLIVADLQERMQCIRQKTAGLPRPRVLVVVYRPLGSGRLEDVCIAIRDGHIDQLVAKAGGQNACRRGAFRFPVVSGEGLLEINPEIIIDLVPEASARELASEGILADWRQAGQLRAVADRRVYVLADDHASIPGPSFILLVEEFARLIHPEVNWNFQ